MDIVLWPEMIAMSSTSQAAHEGSEAPGLIGVERVRYGPGNLPELAVQYQIRQDPGDAVYGVDYTLSASDGAGLEVSDDILTATFPRDGE